MADQYMNMATLKYMLYDVHRLPDLLKYKRFGEYDENSTNMFLDTVKDFCDKDCFPYIKEMDEKPVQYKNGKVMEHPQIETIMKKSGELGLIGSSFNYEDGGMQMLSMMTQCFLIALFGF